MFCAACARTSARGGSRRVGLQGCPPPHGCRRRCRCSSRPPALRPPPQTHSERSGPPTPAQSGFQTRRRCRGLRSHPRSRQRWRRRWRRWRRWLGSAARGACASGRGRARRRAGRAAARRRGARGRARRRAASPRRGWPRSRPGRRPAGREAPAPPTQKQQHHHQQHQHQQHQQHPPTTQRRSKKAAQSRAVAWCL